MWFKCATIFNGGVCELYTVCSERKGMEILFPILHWGPYSCKKTIFLGKIHICTVEWSYFIAGIISGKSSHNL